MKNKTLQAYFLPFAVFMGFLLLNSLISWWFEDSKVLLLAQPKYWIFPLQTMVCAGVLVFYWKHYDFGPLKAWPIGVLAGLVVLGIWISPQAVFGFAPRTDGFNPDLFADQPNLYWLTVISRFARMAIVVALVEEIFWRGLVMRYLINEDFTKVPFGEYERSAFWIVVGLFTLEHATVDWPAAIITGIIYNALAIKTKSLWACVIAHGVTNFGLGLYTMATKQWGFW